MAHPSDTSSSATASRRGRRGFIKMLSGGAAGAVALAGCDTNEPDEEMEADVTLDFSTDVGVLNYAYALEQLEAAFYAEAAANPYADISATEQAYLDDLAAHEGVHRDLFAVALGGDAIPDLAVDFSGIDFDFTAGGAFDPFGDYATFLLLSQAFEDTGVRAYKGQAGGLVGGGDLLTAALQIHSVEARHAAEVRRLRAAMMEADVQPWIVLDDGTDGTPVEAVYAGEENTMQAGVDVTTFGYTAEEATGAFDEPLTMNAVLGIADLFLADG